jgi:hypothetical protein
LIDDVPYAKMRAKTTSSPPPWADLLPELLHDIASRLHVASDNVRFRAVCRAWRAAGDGYSPPSLLPWLLAPSTVDDNQTEDQRCRCVFSHKSYRAPGICVGDRRVAYANGKAAWLVRSSNEETRLALVSADGRLTFTGGECNDEWLHHPHRIVSGDGSVLLYDFDPYYGLFRASFLPPGHGEWLHVSSYLSSTNDHCCAAACHRGGYVVCVDLDNCHVLRPPHCDVRAPLPVEAPGKVREYTYLLKYGGDLLLASVLSDAAACRSVTVSLHELRLNTCRSGGEQQPEVEWVRRDESDSDMNWLGDHALFLGFPGSFALEAALFGGEEVSGTAYFVVTKGISDEKPSYVCRYRFGDAVTWVKETLPAGWHDPNCMWFLPEPQMLTSFEVEGRRGNSGGGARRHQLRIYAGDLPPKVDSARLREMFSVYGKVAKARVAYDKKGRSRGFGFVTMATQQGFDKTMAAVNAVRRKPARPDDSLTFEETIGALALLLIFALFYLVFRGLRAAWFYFF